jgi:hypothetical protein
MGNMAVTITTNAKYSHLNADRSHTIKPGGVGVEKEMVCDIAITGAGNFSATGLVTCDFTQVGFKQVYSCIIEQTNDFALNTYQFVEAALSDAATAKINGRVRTTSAVVGVNTVCTMTVIIRGV